MNEWRLQCQYMVKVETMIHCCCLYRYYTSPKSYTDLISLYTSLLAEKQAEYGEAEDRLNNGLDKLQETNALVDTMQAQLNQLQPVLEEKAQACCLCLQRPVISEHLPLKHWLQSACM